MRFDLGSNGGISLFSHYQKQLNMASKKILCIGGAGQLGRAVIKSFLPYSITNVDFRESESAKSNILLQNGLKASDNNRYVIEQMKKNNEKFDSIIVTAGGWVGGSIKDEDYLAKCQQMLDMNLYPTLLAAHLATKHLSDKGLIVFTGAAAVFREPQPEMIGYAMAKTGVHSTALNLTEHFVKNQKASRVITILPQVIDTQSNRAGMPNADFKKWAKPEQIGELLRGWVDGLNVPNSGSFALLKVKNQCIATEFV